MLVENKLHGLSPELSEAIQSISRWELVQAALPHVLHCTSILLSNRNKLGKGGGGGGGGAPTLGACHSSSIGPDVPCGHLTGHQDKLGVAETKLLHTLHWMLLEAAHECNHEPSLGHGWSAGGSSSSSAFLQPVGNQGSSPGAPLGSCAGSSALGGSGPQHGSSLLEEDENARAKLFNKSMATVELFVFLFAPLIHRIKVRTPISLDTELMIVSFLCFMLPHPFLPQESDLNFRLASGLVIWQPMWEHRQPDIPAFTLLIKPIRNIVTGGGMGAGRTDGRTGGGRHEPV